MDPKVSIAIALAVAVAVVAYFMLSPTDVQPPKPATPASEPAPK